MRKETKLCLIFAAILVICGSILFASVMTAYHWDFKKLNTTEYETNTRVAKDAFRDISISTDTADILFATSEDSNCRIVCYEPENVRHSVTVQDGTLSIQVEDSREWYEHIGITFGTPKITVYLPESQYTSLLIKGSTGDVEIPNNFRFESMEITVSTGDVVNHASATGCIDIEASTGNIRTEDISAGSMYLTVTTGKVTVSNVTCDGGISVYVSTGKANITNTTCESLISEGNTGDISLMQVIAREGFSIGRSTGDIKLDCCDASAIYLETDTGDVTGSLLSGKEFVTHTGTGHVDIPKGTVGGKCTIRTGTGDIKINIQ